MLLALNLLLPFDGKCTLAPSVNSFVKLQQKNTSIGSVSGFQISCSSTFVSSVKLLALGTNVTFVIEDE